MKKNLVCITCPIGCRLTVTHINDVLEVEGNQCKRGIEYAKEELINPKRMIPTTVVIEKSHLRRLPVRTDKPVPKGDIFRCMDEINKIKVQAPIKMGDIIIKNILGLNVNIIATRSMDRIID